MSTIRAYFNNAETAAHAEHRSRCEAADVAWRQALQNAASKFGNPPSPENVAVFNAAVKEAEQLRDQAKAASEGVLQAAVEKAREIAKAVGEIVA
jgi:hypothetical protein